MEEIVGIIVGLFFFSLLMSIIAINVVLTAVVVLVSFIFTDTVSIIIDIVAVVAVFVVVVIFFIFTVFLVVVVTLVLLLLLTWLAVLLGCFTT